MIRPKICSVDHESWVEISKQQETSIQLRIWSFFEVAGQVTWRFGNSLAQLESADCSRSLKSATGGGTWGGMGNWTAWWVCASWEGSTYRRTPRAAIGIARHAHRTLFATSGLTAMPCPIPAKTNCKLIRERILKLLGTWSRLLYSPHYQQQLIYSYPWLAFN